MVLLRGNYKDPAVVRWDGRTFGSWVRELDGADAVINLGGRSVNCRYAEEHRRQMMDSRVESTRAVGMASQRAERPCPCRRPQLWGTLHDEKPALRTMLSAWSASIAPRTI